MEGCVVSEERWAERSVMGIREFPRICPPSPYRRGVKYDGREAGGTPTEVRGIPALIPKTSGLKMKIQIAQTLSLVESLAIVVKKLCQSIKGILWDLFWTTWIGLAKKRNLYQFLKRSVSSLIFSEHFKVLKCFITKHLRDSGNL